MLRLPSREGGGGYASHDELPSCYKQCISSSPALHPQAASSRDKNRAKFAANYHDERTAGNNQQHLRGRQPRTRTSSDEVSTSMEGILLGALCNARGSRFFASPSNKSPFLHTKTQRSLRPPTATRHNSTYHAYCCTLQPTPFRRPPPSSSAVALPPAAFHLLGRPRGRDGHDRKPFHLEGGQPRRLHPRRPRPATHVPLSAGVRGARSTLLDT